MLRATASRLAGSDPADLAAQHGVLVPKYQKFCVFGQRRRASVIRRSNRQRTSRYTTEMLTQDDPSPPARQAQCGNRASQARQALRARATGPDAYDCSGLAMMASRAAGITIPRTSQAQWAYGTQTLASQAQPGDLVFFAGSDGTPAAPGHVGIVLNPAAHTHHDRRLRNRVPRRGRHLRAPGIEGRTVARGRLHPPALVGSHWGHQRFRKSERFLIDLAGQFGAQQHDRYGTITSGTGQWRAGLTATEPTMRWLADLLGVGQRDEDHEDPADGPGDDRRGTRDVCGLERPEQPARSDDRPQRQEQQVVEPIGLRR